MNTLRIAWRNIWRNKRRTAITAAAVALNTAILIASWGLMDGMMVDTVHNITHMITGDAQIHAPEYRADRSFYQVVENPGAILDEARRAGIHAAPRSYGYGLVSAGSKSAGAMFWGVDPVAEREGFELAKQMLRGGFLSPRPEKVARRDKPVPASTEEVLRAKREIVLGRKLAKSLHADVGSEIVAVVQAGDGSLGNELFVVKGIFKTTGDEIDRFAAITHQTDFEELFVSQGRIHQIALNAKGTMSPEEVQARLSGVAGQMEIMTWKELMPALSDMVNLFDAGMAIFGFIFLLAAGLGVMNTMLMATYERIREFGMLKAMGATPWRIIRDVSAEALMLALFATAIGLILGVGSNLYFHHVGLDLSGIGGDVIFSGVAFNPVWKATMTSEGITSPVVSMWVICVLAALWPAVKAARLKPVKAMTHV